MMEPTPAPPTTIPSSPFREAVEALLKATEEAVPPLHVLVWGPAEDPDNPWWRKRIQIRDRLRAEGHEAYFSEELPGGAPETGDARRIALRTAEYAHAIVADYIVVLMGAVGAVSEFHDFGDKPDLARKMLVFVDAEHQTGYAASSMASQFEATHGKIRWIKFPADLDECRVLGWSLDEVDKIKDLRVFQALDGAPGE